jgi:hypothetical protein
MNEMDRYERFSLAACKERIAKLETDAELAVLATATLRDESIAKNVRIATLEAALRKIVALFDNEDFPDDSGELLQIVDIANYALGERRG